MGLNCDTTARPQDLHQRPDRSKFPLRLPSQVYIIYRTRQNNSGRRYDLQGNITNYRDQTGVFYVVGGESSSSGNFSGLVPTPSGEYCRGMFLCAQTDSQFQKLYCMPIQASSAVRGNIPLTTTPVSAAIYPANRIIFYEHDGVDGLAQNRYRTVYVHMLSAFIFQIDNRVAGSSDTSANHLVPARGDF